MRKQLLIAAVLLLSSGAYAQSGALTINNTNPICTVYVSVIGIAPMEGDGAPCSLTSVSIMLGPGQTARWNSISDFATGVPGTPTPVIGGFTPAPSPILPAAWPAVTDFIYTDAKFQFQCPPTSIPPCSDGGGEVSVPALGLPSCFMRILPGRGCAHLPASA